MDHSGRTHEGESGAPGPAQSPSVGDPSGGERNWPGQAARVSEGGWIANREHGHVGTAPGLRIAAVRHGFPSSLQDWAEEDTDHPRDVTEAALAHKVRNPIEAAY